ncbi:HlyD family efflux transporter periplasmic adaptor subunit [Anaeropeptidivorans aminofermentans]|uniref:HlyD family efflux transporter periplasmic adaptor subunit n=1 Tax=Anaeropeptidivorans aminofermentans TaxID=2934315 RepID=UPI0020246376|nr:HlyD family efflux transporter periplasmic adaptor subunit [Anaeropeptidivorans aminofermentans]
MARNINNGNSRNGKRPVKKPVRKVPESRKSPPARASTKGPERENNVVPFNARKRAAAKRASATRDLIIMITALALFSISVGGTIYKYATKKDIATMVVPMGSVDIPRVINGIIIRDEAVYRSNAGGNVDFWVADKQKVKSGTVVCSIKNPETTKALENQSEILSQKILDMQSLRTEVSAFTHDVSNINKKIKSDIDKNLFLLSGDDFSAVYKLKDSVEKNINKRNELLLSEGKGSLESYVNENRQYSEKLSQSIATVSVTEGGIVSYVVDGFEELLNFSNMDQVRKEETVMQIVPKISERVKEASEGSEVFKIVKSNEWYIASYIENDLTLNWKESDTVKLYLDKDGEYMGIDFKIEELERREKESFVLFKSNKQMYDFLDMRSVSFKTYDSIYSGIKIPENAITERTFLKIPEDYVINSKGRDVVYKLINDKTEEVAISMKSLRLNEDKGGYVYVMQDFNNIKRGDTVIMPEKEKDSEGEENAPAANNLEKTYVIDEIVVSKGVFKANSGIASFTSISTEGMTKGNNGYVILPASPEGSASGIKIYDIIVSDAVNNYIQEGDRIN